MCAEKENEKLIEALVEAARAAFLSLKDTTKEHFYFYALILRSFGKINNGTANTR